MLRTRGPEWGGRCGCPRGPMRGAGQEQGAGGWGLRESRAGGLRTGKGLAFGFCLLCCPQPRCLCWVLLPESRWGKVRGSPVVRTPGSPPVPSLLPTLTI